MSGSRREPDPRQGRLENREILLQTLWRSDQRRLEKDPVVGRMAQALVLTFLAQCEYVDARMPEPVVIPASGGRRAGEAQLLRVVGDCGHFRASLGRRLLERLGLERVVGGGDRDIERAPWADARTSARR